MHFSPLRLTLRQRRTWFAHVFKALVYQHHKPFAQMIRPLLAEDSVIVDVGGHAGQFTKLLAGLAPRGHVYTFEPGSYALSILRRVVWAHRLRNVTLIPKGLSDSASTAKLNVPIKKSGALGFGMSHIASSDEANVASHEVALTTLDEFTKEFTRLDMIKIDIEGWELHALRGARQTLAKHRPILLVEIVHGALFRASATPADILAEFAALNYRLFKTDEKQNYKTWSVNGHEGDGDYLFVPAERVDEMTKLLLAA